MGDLSGNTQLIFKKVKKSFSLAKVEFRANRQGKGLEILSEDLVHYVDALVSALREIMGNLNELEARLIRIEGKVDKLEAKLDKMEDVSVKLEAKLDNRDRPAIPGIPDIPGGGTVRPGGR